MADHGRGCYEEFEEEEVWAAAALKDAKDGSPRSRTHAVVSGSPSRFLPTGSRTIPRPINARAESSGGTALRQSAPVRVPIWHSSAVHSKNIGYNDSRCREEDNDQDDDEDRAPPHEYLAKKLARNQISSSSVCEGAGRTLKGRDLRKVRNAVLTKTGFLE